MSKKISRKEDRRRACGSETEVCLSDFMKPTEQEATLFVRFVDSEFVLGGTRELARNERSEPVLKRGMETIHVKEAA